MESVEAIVKSAHSALEPFPQIGFAVLFGSAATGRLRLDSDIDVAVYFSNNRRLEIEEGREHDGEVEIQIALERATDRNVDLLILNRAPACVCAAALLSGRKILIRDDGLYTRYFLAVTSVAIEFLQTEKEFLEVHGRSTSISEIDRSRMVRILNFIEEELLDQEKFRAVGLGQYRGERDMRRNLDRWVEMLINSAIDIGKIVLASERRSAPQTYGQILAELESLPAFAGLAGRLAPLAALRNLMAHEYLDLRFGRVKSFAESGAGAIADLAAHARDWLDT